MKKAGIITFHCSYNYGSALQAYALQTVVAELGWDARIIDYRLSANFDQFRLLRTQLYRSQPRSAAADLLFFLPHLKRKRSFEGFWKRHFRLTPKTYRDGDGMQALNDCMDAFLCGSDQIWNLDCTQGICEPYFLGFAGADKKKIAYAPSLAHVSFANADTQRLAALVNRLDAVSVREESTVPYLAALVDRPISVTLDPTLLLPPQAYEALAVQPKTAEEYIFVYMLEENEELKAYCRRLREQTGSELFYLTGKYNTRGFTGTNLYGIDPEQFLGYIRGARYVVTNSFHATVFSVLLGKPFAAFATEHSGARVRDLLAKLSLSDRLYREGFAMDTPVDFAAAHALLALEREKSMDFLKNALEQENGNARG